MGRYDAGVARAVGLGFVGVGEPVAGGDAVVFGGAVSGGGTSVVDPRGDGEEFSGCGGVFDGADDAQVFAGWVAGAVALQFVEAGEQVIVGVGEGEHELAVDAAAIVCIEDVGVLAGVEGVVGQDGGFLAQGMAGQEAAIVDLIVAQGAVDEDGMLVGIEHGGLAAR